MLGSVVGSLGASTRYAERLSALSSNWRAASRSGTRAWPGTRTAFGSQNSGWADAKPPKSSIASRYPGRLKDLASVEETLHEAAVNFFRLERRRWPESNDDVFLLDIDGVDRLGHRGFDLGYNRSHLVCETVRIRVPRSSVRNQARRRPLLDRTQRGLCGGDLGGQPTQFEEIDKVPALPAARRHGHGAPRMEAASGRRMDGVGHLSSRQHLPAAASRVRYGDRLQEGPNIRMLRVRVDTLRGAHLHDPSEVHDRDSVADEFRRRQVVRDEQVRRAVPLLEVEYELEHPGPDGHVEHRDGLVGDNQLRLEDHRPRDHGPLLLAAAQVGRILPVKLFRRRQADLRHDVQRGALGFLLLGRLVNDQWVRDALADRHRGVEGGVRVLEDNLHSLPQRPELRFFHVRDVEPVEADRPRGGLKQSKHRAAHGGLSATAFPDESEDLASPQAKRNAVDGVDRELSAPKKPLNPCAPHRKVLD